LTIVAKPIGRGNWKPLVLECSGAHLLPMSVVVGAQFVLGAVTWRVCEVRP
jgi:hypothetical protein